MLLPRADGWAQANRTGRQPIDCNTARFPNGMEALADYVHARGARRCCIQLCSSHFMAKCMYLGSWAPGRPEIWRVW